jgi:hypothetical protein
MARIFPGVNLVVDDRDIAPSYRDQEIAAKRDKADSQKIILTEDSIRKELDKIEANISAADVLLASLVSQINDAQSEGNTDVAATLQGQYNSQFALRQDLAKERNNTTLQLVKFKVGESNAAKEAIAPKNTSGTKSNDVPIISTTTGAQSLGTFSPVGTTDLQYNASTVRESYFSSTPAFTKQMRFQSNSPSAVGAATELWNTANGSKGMIVTSAATVKAWNSGSQLSTSAQLGDNHNYGFQFMYNPGTVSMNYFTSPNIDVTMMTSGQDLFNLSGVAGSQGSVGFQIIINRIFDMQYFDRFGVKRQGAEQAYSKPPRSNQEWKELYNKGTMYDIEYLLRTLMGTTMSSYLRGQNTADMGWLPAIPVELHLGKSLRYLGTINSFNLNHTIFDERMVPLFTTVDVQFARLPDYPAT